MDPELLTYVLTLIPNRRLLLPLTTRPHKNSRRGSLEGASLAYSFVKENGCWHSCVQLT